MAGHYGQFYLKRQRDSLAGRERERQFGMETMPIRVFLSIVAFLVVIVGLVQWAAD